MDGNLYGNVWIYGVLSKTLIDTKPVHIIFNKIDGFIIVYNANRHLLLLFQRNIISFTIGLDIL